jgi:hypothetical protein
MGADDAWSAEIKRLPFTPDSDPLALDEDFAERLLDGDLSPDQAPPGYAEVAELLAATVAAPSSAELAGQEAALAELRAVTRARRAIPRGSGRPGRRRRVGLLVAVAVCALSTTGIAAATTGMVPDPIRDIARRILATVDDATPMPSTTPGRQLAPSTGDAPAVGATSKVQGAGPGGEPEATAGTGTSNDQPCRASKARKGADRSKKPNAVTSQAPVEAAGDADNVTSECQKSRPDGTGGNGQEQHPPSDGHGRGQGGEPPPDAESKPGQGQAGPPPNGGGGNPEKGRPLETGQRRTSSSTSR